jgi:hypothetical protein
MDFEVGEFDDYKSAMNHWDNGCKLFHDPKCEVEFVEGDSFSTDGRKYYFKLNEFPIIVNADYSKIILCDWKCEKSDIPKGHRLMIVREVFERE